MKIFALAFFAAIATATPAAASREITYSGIADFRYYTTVGIPVANIARGLKPFSAVFRYDDTLALASAAFSVGGIAREHFVCASLLPQNCSALSIGSNSIHSGVGTTPEDGASLSVTSPGGFGSVPLLGPGHQVYVTVPGDDTLAFLTFAYFDRPGFGFAYSDGFGTIDRIETGVPEPSVWVMLLGGFGLTCLSMRRRLLPVR